MQFAGTRTKIILTTLVILCIMGIISFLSVSYYLAYFNVRYIGQKYFGRLELSSLPPDVEAELDTLSYSEGKKANLIQPLYKKNGFEYPIGVIRAHDNNIMKVYVPSLEETLDIDVKDSKIKFLKNAANPTLVRIDTEFSYTFYRNRVVSIKRNILNKQIESVTLLEV